VLLKQDKLLMVLPRLVKKVIGKWCYIKEGKEKNTHTWDRWTCANGKEWSRGTRKSSLSDCTWLENEYGSFNLETLKLLIHFREPGSSLYFIFILYILTFFSFSLFFFSYSYFCSFFISSLFFSFSFSEFFYLLPLNSKIALYLPPPPCLDIARPRARW
jgi:hypothetical protein